jgi:hypothetical protein
MHESDNLDLCSDDFSISISIGESSKDVSSCSSYLHYGGGDIVVPDEVSQSVDNLYQASENRSSGYSTPDSDEARSEGVGFLINVCESDSNDSDSVSSNAISRSIYNSSDDSQD